MICRMFRDTEYRVQPCREHGWDGGLAPRPVYRLHEAKIELLQCVLSNVAAWPDSTLATEFLDQIYTELARRT